MDKGPEELDNHIKPIWTSCPFCSVEFDVVGHLEEFDKDSAFIHVAMDLMVKSKNSIHFVKKLAKFLTLYHESTKKNPENSIDL